MKNFLIGVLILIVGAITGLVFAHCPKVQQLCPVMNRCDCKDSKCCRDKVKSGSVAATCEECNCPCSAGKVCNCGVHCSCNKGVSCPGKKPKSCKNCEKQ
jgi:hypothetical protein